MAGLAGWLALSERSVENRGVKIVVQGSDISMQKYWRAVEL